MTAYFYRLLCLSLASFFLIHLFSGLAIIALQRPLIRRAERLRATAAARLLFTIRLLPLTIAAILLALLCIPSYLQLEPHAWSEPVGPWCLAAALFGTTICTLSALRTVRAVIRSSRYQRSCRPTAHKLYLPEEISPVGLIQSPSPALALAGIFRPKLLVSRHLLDTLSAEELRSAIRHERAHQSSRDNLKRLILLLTPDILPFCSIFTGYDHTWARLTEWAADDQVVADGPDQTLSLATALVRVARLNAATMPVPLMTSLLSDISSLSARVERLLAPPVSSTPPIRRFNIAAAAITTSAALFVALAAQTATLHFVHELLERLIR